MAGCNQGLTLAIFATKDTRDGQEITVGSPRKCKDDDSVSVTANISI